MTRTEYPWLLPSAMAAPADPETTGKHGGRQPRRTVRDWGVDLLAFVFAVFIGMVALDTADKAGNSEPLLVIDLLIGLAACGLLWVRRRWPVGLAVGLSLVQVVSPMGAAPPWWRSSAWPSTGRSSPWPSSGSWAWRP